MPPEENHLVDDFFHPHRPRKPQPPENPWAATMTRLFHACIGICIGITFGSLFRDDRNWGTTVCTVVTCLWGCYALFAVIVVEALDAAERRRNS